jgi:hypothetical protein
MSDFDQSLFWPEFLASGMLQSVRVKQSGRAAVDVNVSWREPDDTNVSGQQSREYVIEYQVADLPNLAEADPVTKLDAAGEPVRTQRYIVRRVPFNDDPSADGYFRRALLTKL